jgi:hypothetical protein
MSGAMRPTGIFDFSEIMAGLVPPFFSIALILYWRSTAQNTTEMNSINGRLIFSLSSTGFSSFLFLLVTVSTLS